MTLQQLRYVTTVADTGTISRAAQQFYISQPSLTNAIRELEQEVGLTIFHRTNRGVALTPEGEEFLGYARQVLAQIELIEEKYLGSAPVKHQFCVSAQHYSFAVEAFVELLKEYGGEEYDFRIRETQTYEIIEDVAKLRSEVGVLYLNHDNETVLRKVIREHDLIFTPFFTAKPHVFVSATSPLAQKKALTLDDLKLYPRLSYEQGEQQCVLFFGGDFEHSGQQKGHSGARPCNSVQSADRSGWLYHLQRRHQRGTQRSEHPCRAAFGG